MPKRRKKKKIINDQLSIINGDKEVGQKSRSKSGKVAVKVLTVRENKDNQDVISARQSDDGESQFNREKDEQKKRLIMWLGVGGIMAALLVVWFFNLKNEFRISARKSADNGFNWSQAKNELDKAMAQVKQGLAEVKQLQESLKQKASSSEPALTPERINLLKGKLLNEAATGTASGTVKK